MQRILDPASLSTIFANITFFVIFQCLFFYFVVSKKYEAELADKTGILKPFVENSPLLGKLLCKKLLNDATRKNQQYEGVHWKIISNDKSKSGCSSRAVCVDDIEDDTLKRRIENQLTDRKNWITSEIDKNETKLKEEKEQKAIDEIKNHLRFWKSYKEDVEVKTHLQIYDLKTKSDDTYKVGNVVKSGDTYYQCISIREEKDILNRYALLKAMSLFVVPSVIICIILIIISVHQKKWGTHHSWAMGLIAGCFTTEVIFYFLVLEGHMIVGDWELIHGLFKK